MTMLASLTQTVTKKVIEIRNPVYFFDSLVYVILNTSKQQVHFIHEHITGLPVTVSWLSDGSDIDHGFLIFESPLVINLIWTIEVTGFRKNTWNMGVSLETVPIHERNSFSIFLSLWMSSGKTYSLSGSRGEPCTKRNGSSR